MGWLNDLSARSEELIYNKDFIFENGITVWLAGKAGENDPGILSTLESDESIVFVVGSGSYKFLSKTVS
jgi:hypothetical protein